MTRPAPLDKKGWIEASWYEKELGRVQRELVKLQEWVRTEGLRVCVLFEGRDDGVECNEDFLCDFVASELGQKFLLGGQVKVLVAVNLFPDTLSVHGETVCGNPAVVFRKQDRFGRLIDQASPLRVLVTLPEAKTQPLNLLNKLLRL